LSDAAGSPLEVGAAEVVITPPLGVESVGYGPNRELRSAAIHRQLTAQALVVRDGAQAAAIVVCDLVAVTPEFVAAVRARVERETGIAAGNVLVAATHSHSSPSTGSLADFGRTDREYVRLLVRIVSGAVGWAQRRAEPAQLYVGRTVHEGLAWNRTGASTVDEELQTLHAVNRAGAVIAVIAQHACHPVTLGPNTILSPDFPGAFRERIREAAPQCVALYLNGACGDVDPITNRDAWGQGSVKDVERLGARLADTGFAAMQAAAPVEDPGIAVVSGSLRLDYELPTPERLRREIARLGAERRRRRGQPDQPFGAPAEGDVRMPGFWLRHYRRLERRFERGELEDHELVELQALRLGRDVVVLAIPAEVYAEQGLQIKHASPFTHTLLACYANGCCGYLPPEREFTAGGYTATLAAAAYDRPPFRSDVARRLVDRAEALLRAAREGESPTDR
jgi:neutral ceramidase